MSIVAGNQKAWIGLVGAVVGVAVGAGFIDADQGASITNLAATVITALVGFAGVWLKGNNT